MNPDRLFNYLDGRLPAHERAAVEEELMNDEQARREFEVARRIHLGMQNTHTDRPEILSERAGDPLAGGRKIGGRVLAAAFFLVVLNVAFGIFIIARHEGGNPNNEALRQQSETRVRQALEKASASELTPAPLGLSEVAVSVQSGAASSVADGASNLAAQTDGSATKGMPDAGKITLLAEIPSARAREFVKGLSSLAQVKSVSGGSGNFGADAKTTIVVQIAEEK